MNRAQGRYPDTGWRGCRPHPRRRVVSHGPIWRGCVFAVGRTRTGRAQTGRNALRPAPGQLASTIQLITFGFESAMAAAAASAAAASGADASAPFVHGEPRPGPHGAVCPRQRAPYLQHSMTSVRARLGLLPPRRRDRPLCVPQRGAYAPHHDHRRCHGNHDPGERHAIRAAVVQRPPHLHTPSHVSPTPRSRPCLADTPRRCAPRRPTTLQKRKFDEAAFRGERFKDYDRDIQGNNDLLSLTQPDAIRDIHM